MPLERIADVAEPCRDPQHKFTGDKRLLRPGIYRWTCPACKKAVIFASHPGALPVSNHHREGSNDP